MGIKKIGWRDNMILAFPWRVIVKCIADTRFEKFEWYKVTRRLTMAILRYELFERGRLHTRTVPRKSAAAASWSPNRRRTRQ